MNQQTYLSALAGLLHDIGKFMLRAGEGGTRTWDETAEQDFKYKHALLSSDFAEKFIPDLWRVAVKNPVANHHRPQSRDDLAVTLADRLSAGERDDATPSKPGEQAYQQLLSIFCSVQADGITSPQELYLPLTVLKMERSTLFPAHTWPERQVKDAYQGLWEELQQAAAQLRNAHDDDGDLPAFLETMLLLLQRYLWCSPSAYWRTRPDVSLYDHCRMTAALAAVFASSELDEARLKVLIDQREISDELALLVGGDISGIQDFIYTISSRGAASALRGRSFYLQLLTEAIIRYILNEFELPITNLIYAGGGKFYILARPSDAARIPAIQQHISRILLQHHRGELYVALAEKSLTGRDFYQGRISEAWAELDNRLQGVKLKRFSELDAEDLRWLFEAHGDGGNEDRQCQVCGQEHIDAKADDNVRKCPPCLSYETLGEKLRSARFLLLQSIESASVDIKASPGNWQQSLAAFGLHADVSAQEDELVKRGERVCVVLALKDDALDGLYPQAKKAVGRRFLVNVTPTLNADEWRSAQNEGLSDLPRVGSTKPFHIMEWQSQGVKRLGVLRMDVDNLGGLFAEGLAGKATLSRVASLSFAVSLFFDGWVEQLAVQQESSPEGWDERLYSIYSGGDDLFFVGAWDAIAEFARRVRADLTPYAAFHPGIHASAGITLVGGKYPLYQAAGDAGTAEARAKAFHTDSRAKDAICFLNQVQPWSLFGLKECDEHEESVHGLMHLLVGMLDDRDGQRKAAPKSLLRNMSLLYAEYAEAEEKRRKAGKDVNRTGQPQPLWGPWMWRGFYMLRRMGKRTGISEIDHLADKLHDDEFRNMDWIGLAARWAELYSR
ncbi:MAG: type III-A CRISPR-associated protein Cas10/Csm1 [Caldilineales bacterium]|nr:type III-A CRISPR-associated protein Cas10/Csm1 [Caldilineales bacterium]